MTHAEYVRSCCITMYGVVALSQLKREEKQKVLVAVWLLEHAGVSVRGVRG